MTRTLAIFLSVMLTMGTVHAGSIYKYTLPNGNVVYSDKPPPADQGEKVTLEPLQSFTLPPPPPLEDSTAKNTTPEPAGYETFQVTDPTNDATIRDNGGNVRVSLRLSPGLQSGHSIEVMMDGQSIGAGQGTSVTLADVDRGTHTVQAAVKDNEGKEVVRSNSVIFHLKRGGG
ncbi:MAG: DUF4124 domain-containing protein [Gammaproteobacteria bacterium]|nr:DUF4124 domain-containing protein [Gammaproteobacteria bacterium]MDX2462653.1 DUF4124 domain-containing protein [Gammaproteobacteria bacterium]